MPHYTEYVCGQCNKPYPKERLVAKIILFKMVGAGGKVLKSRTQGWLCMDNCLEEDPMYNKEAYDSPGLISAGRERVRRALSRERNEPIQASTKIAQG